MFSERQYVSKTDKRVYYIVIVQEEKDLSEEISLKNLKTIQALGDKMEEMVEDHPQFSVALSEAGQRVFPTVLENHSQTLLVGAQTSQECKAEAQYLLLAIYQAFIKRFQLLQERVEGIRGHLCDQTQREKQSD